ncbi:MAG: limonene-1,2-epoxide hydrolase family protein [Pseudomonadota bacterium]
MSNTQVVLDFVQAWNDKNWDAIEALFTDDVVYHNMPMEPAEGKGAAMAIIRGMQPQEVDWRVLNIAENGDVVLTERVDDFVMGDGKKVSVQVMGTMELEDGKIKAWRDYFDLASFTSQMA